MSIFTILVFAAMIGGVIGAQYRAKLGAVKTDTQFEALVTKMLGELARA
jgi:uncharacterized protein YdbL (DUF1318 family)